MAFEVQQVLFMNRGEGERSYANNSTFQKEAMRKTRPCIEEGIKTVYRRSDFPECFKMADLGCSSGPNTLILVREIVDITEEICKQLKRKDTRLLVFLNDLPGNDFNTIFRSLPTFYEKLKKEKGQDFGSCLIAGMPGSFYHRLFPNDYLHFVHSCYSLHWLSKVPEGLVSESGSPLNKRNICAAETSPPSVLKAYLDRFERDFMVFLRLRSEEMIPGGQMVITMLGNDRKSNHRCAAMELLGTTLHDMVLEGLTEEEKLDWFDLPFFTPAEEEIRHVVQEEGSFTIEEFETFGLDWDFTLKNCEKSSSYDDQTRGKFVAMSLRAVVEPILASHFGDQMMDELFERYARKAARFMEVEKGENTNIVVRMTKLRNDFF